MSMEMHQGGEITQATDTAFMDSFRDIVQRQTDKVTAERIAEQQRLLDEEKADIDQMYEDDLQKRKAMGDRAETFKMAWLAAGLLSQSGVRTDSWFRDVPNTNIETVGRWPRRRQIQSGTRPEIAVEGWKFYDFNVIKPRNSDRRFSLADRATTLILLEDGGISAITKWDRYEQDPYDWKPQPVQGVGVREVMPLSKDPSEDRGLSWTRLERPYDKNGEQIGLGKRITIPGRKNARLHSDRRGEDAAYIAGGGERHNRYKIEDRIRTALGELLAQNNVTIP